MLVGAALLVIACFVVYVLVSDMMQIQKDNETYNKLVNQTNAVNEQNAQIANYLENDENLKEYIEEIAREKLDYANPNERIYYVVPAAE
ncbi:MAG: septum formation initiator family protein [Oscillospiraceae bacterium]|nr:septum formation initiator family protein [Oscillospiraceae bacterium]